MPPAGAGKWTTVSLEGPGGELTGIDVEEDPKVDQTFEDQDYHPEEDGLESSQVTYIPGTRLTGQPCEGVPAAAGAVEVMTPAQHLKDGTAVEDILDHTQWIPGHQEDEQHNLPVTVSSLAALTDFDDPPTVAGLLAGTLEQSSGGVSTKMNPPGPTGQVDLATGSSEDVVMEALWNPDGHVPPSGVPIENQEAVPCAS